MSTLDTARPKTRTWTREEYHRAAELGLFDPDERLELLEGEIVEKISPQSNPHAAGVSLAAEVLRSIFTRGYHVREEKPIVLSDFSEPEPDIVVVKGALRDTPRHPTQANTLLVVEVSESSLATDRKTKGAIYAKHGILEYWILNLRRRELEVRRDPGLIEDDEYGYRFLQVIPESGSATPIAAPDNSVLVADMLPSELPSDAI